jgi:hypothetical protein
LNGWNDRLRVAGAGLVVALAPALAAGASTDQGIDPQVGSGPPLPGLRDAQNEPAIAVDAGALTRGIARPSQPLAIGANEYFDQAPCGPGGCTFVPGVGVSGIYFSMDGGANWTKQGQLKYVGFTARAGLPARAGRIVTVPRFAKLRASHGDPSLAFGPIPAGRFDWANGSRLYYATLAQRFKLPEAGPQVIAVSRTDRLTAAAAGTTSAWLPPVIVSNRTSRDAYADKPALWADNVASSPHFGAVYVCWASYRSAREAEEGGNASPILFSRSTDGGTVWSTPITLSPGTGGDERQGCAIRTDSNGVVYVVWEGSAGATNAIFLTRSGDGGVTFSAAQAVARVSDVGALDPVLRARGLEVRTFDGVLGSRTNSWPSLDIANGAPFGNDDEHERPPDTIVLAWADGPLNQERALVTFSRDRGTTWSRPANAAAATAPPPFRLERPDLPAVAISPNGVTLYVVYTAFHDPWQKALTGPRRLGGVMRSAKFSDFEARGQAATWREIRGAVGDARATASVSGEERSLRSGVAVEFIGDYNSVVATNEAGYAVWFDPAGAKQCAAVNRFRAGVLRAPLKPPEAPNVRQACPRAFGNGNLFGGVASPGD